MKRQFLMPGPRRKTVVGSPSPNPKSRRGREAGSTGQPADEEEPSFCGEPEQDARTLESQRPGLMRWTRDTFPNLYDCDLPEVVQRTIVKAFTHRGQYDPKRAKLFTWLCAIAKNKARDQLRMRKRERARSTPLETCSELDLPKPKSPGEQCEERRIKDKLDKIIADLPEPQRTVVRLYARNEKPSLARIGREMGITTRQARKAFREAMITIYVAIRRRYYGPPA